MRDGVKKHEYSPFDNSTIIIEDQGRDRERLLDKFLFEKNSTGSIQ